MSLSDLLAQRVIVTGTCPTRRTVTPVVAPVLVVSDETARFGWCPDGHAITVPVVSIDNGVEAAEEALSSSQG